MTEPAWLAETRKFFATKQEFFSAFEEAGNVQASPQLRWTIAQLIVRYREEAQMSRGGWKVLWRERSKLPAQLEEMAAKLEANVGELQVWGHSDMPARMRDLAQSLRIRPSGIDEKGSAGNRHQLEVDDLIRALAAVLRWPKGIDSASFAKVLKVVRPELGKHMPLTDEAFIKRSRTVLRPCQAR